MEKTICELQEELVQMIKDGFGDHVLLKDFNIWDFIYDKNSTLEDTRKCLHRSIDKILKSLEKESEI